LEPFVAQHQALWLVISLHNHRLCGMNALPFDAFAAGIRKTREFTIE